jgi:hypothetical protein
LISPRNLLILALLLVACSDESYVGTVRHSGPDMDVIDAGTTESTDVVVAAASGCTRDQDCPLEQYCYGSSACGSTWSCQDGFPPCSAAAPFMACGCDGSFVSVAAGCPGRHAWPAYFLYSEYTGSPCDPDTPLEAEDLKPLDLVYQGRELTSFNGVTVRVRIRALQTPPPGTPDEVALVQDGAFDFTWPSSFGDPSYSYFNALTLFDLNDDGVCDPDETIVMARIPNPFNLTITTASLSLTPENLADFASHCDWWNE